jgi:hypothetical protein
VRAVGRGLLKFLRIYAAYFLLVLAIVVVGYGIEVGGFGTIVLCLLIGVALLYLSARVGGVRWPER